MFHHNGETVSLIACETRFMALRTSIWVAVVSSSTRRVLLARRAPTTRNAGQWNFFGGGLNPGERPFRTALRELQEEAGIVATKDDLIELGNAATYSKKNILYGLRVDDEFAPVLNGESTHWEWVAVSGLERRGDLHLPTSLLLGSLSAWLVRFPKFTESLQIEDEVEEYLESRALPILDLSP